jgi:hypothetical protein
MATLRDFLSDIARDPERWAEFEENPEDVMNEAGLSQRDQEAVLSRDPEKLRKALGAGPKSFLIIIITFKGR